MQLIEITCITKSGSWPTLSELTAFSGPDGKWTREEMVKILQAKTASFFITVNGQKSDLAVFPSGATMLVRSHRFGVWNDNLLALPKCGAGA